MKNWRYRIRILILLAILLAGFLWPYFCESDPVKINPRFRLQPPTAAHPMGTDEFGRDVLSRTAFGARTSLSIGLSVVVITTLIGTFFGFLCGLYSTVDRVIMRVFDGWMAFPEIILAIALAAVWGSGPYVIIGAMTFAYTPRLARVARSAVLATKDQDYIDAVRSIGAGDLHIVTRHLLPNCLSPIVVQATYLFASAILAEAALSFLGVGIQPPQPSWGGMISDARDYLPIAPWLVLFPGAAMFVAVLALNLLGDQLQDWLNPHFR